MNEMQDRQLTKSSSNRFLNGTIAGIGEYFGLSRDVITLLRIAYVVLALASAVFPFVIVYVVVSMIIPNPTRNRRSDDSYQRNDHPYDNYRNNSYEDKWERKAQKWADKVEERGNKYQDKYQNKFTQTPWYDEKDKLQKSRKIKNAEPVSRPKKEEKDDWSDF